MIGVISILKDLGVYVNKKFYYIRLITVKRLKNALGVY